MIVVIAFVVLLLFSIFLYLRFRRRGEALNNMDASSWLLVGLSLLAIASILAFVAEIFIDGFTC
jgi:multisubunit Na+/H+ antiporter MnhB subunit